MAPAPLQSGYQPRNLGALIDRAKDASQVALIALDDNQAESRYTYGELDALADACARGLLARGLTRGDRIAVLSANRAEYLALMLGAQRVGIVFVPINYKFPRALSDFVAADSGARMIFCDAPRRAHVPENLPVVEFGKDGADGFDALLQPGAVQALDPAADEAAMFLYTSGSTGRPKGVVLSHASHLWVVRTRLAGQDLSGQRYLIAAPMYHMNALALCQLALASHATIVLLPQFKARAYIEATARYRCTWLTAVPPMVAMMLRETDILNQADLSSVQVIRMGSAPVSESLLHDITAALPHAKVINSYGTTEGGPVVFAQHPDGLATPAMSVGYAHPQVSLRLLDAGGQPAPQGVLQLKSPGVMLGYHNRPDKRDALTPDGYYVTGDVFRRDAQGFYYFVGRDDDMFVSGGENIFPGEVEKVIETHPGVQQACVVPIPDDIKGQKPVAFVVAKAGAALDEEEIKQYVLANAPAYQHPRRVWIVDALPLASTNKLDRNGLKARAIEQLGLAAA